MGMFTSAVLGGLSVGIGCGIMMRVGCASGGDDALAMIISKVTSLKLSTVCNNRWYSTFTFSKLYTSSSASVLYSSCFNKW